jgi:hypothetical protein
MNRQRQKREKDPGITARGSREEAQAIRQTVMRSFSITLLVKMGIVI